MQNCNGETKQAIRHPNHEKNGLKPDCREIDLKHIIHSADVVIPEEHSYA
jgi:hypothetical protein